MKGYIIFFFLFIIKSATTILDCITTQNGDDPTVMYLPLSLNCFDHSENYHFELINISLLGKDNMLHPGPQELVLVSSKHILYLSSNEILLRPSTLQSPTHYGKHIYSNGQAFSVIHGEFWGHKILPTFSSKKITYSSEIKEYEKGALLQSEFYFGKHKSVNKGINIDQRTRTIFESLSNQSDFEKDTNQLRILINELGKSLFKISCSYHNKKLQKIEKISRRVDKMIAWLERDDIFVEEDGNRFLVSKCKDIIPDKIFLNNMYEEKCYEKLPVLVDKHLYFVDSNNKLTTNGGLGRICEGIPIISNEDFIHNIRKNEQSHPEWFKNLVNVLYEIEYAAHYFVCFIIFGLIGYILYFSASIIKLLKKLKCFKLKMFKRKNKRNRCINKLPQDKDEKNEKNEKIEMNQFKNNIYDDYV